jgi:HEAT repeat protein
MNDPDTLDPNAPTDDLISFALSHPPTDDWPDPHWDAISVLHERGSREVFDAATRLLASECAAERTLGATLHAQIRQGQEKPFAAGSVSLLVRLLETEVDANVVYAVLMAFGHLQRPECVPAALRFADHPDPDIRYGVTFALAGRDDENAIAALIALTTDPCEKVRDWATFDLGSHRASENGLDRSSHFGYRCRA